MNEFIELNRADKEHDGIKSTCHKSKITKGTTDKLVPRRIRISNVRKQ